MTPRTRLWGTITAFAGAGLVSVLLYQRTRVYDVGDRAAVVSSIRELQRWSAQVSRETLATRYGLVPYYDSLTRADKRLYETSERLVGQLAEVRRGRAPIDAGMAAVRNSIASRRKDIEHFKSENAILRNSLYYLPLAARELNVKLTEQPGIHGTEVPRALDAVVETTLVFNLIRSDAGREQNTASIAALEALGPSFPAPLTGDFELFLRHARTVQRQHDVVNPLTSRIIGSPLDAELGQLERAYLAEVEGALAGAERYRAALYGWSVLLLLAFVGAAYKLRSVYANLERLVRERTKKLDEALAELWGEMELAKRIQTALVPSTPSLAGCDVAATMRPATQVGGDYYDVLEVDGVQWILIGDVSGHGVPAGLVMMMFQTAVRTAIQENPRLEPSELLALVNRSLTANIRRLGENKYMTVSALRRVEGGRFRFSGMHQDLLVFRAKSRRVEEIPTEGPWLGVDDEIGDLMTVRELDLESGDSLLLYTDGLTEAAKDGAILDNDGLKDVFALHGNRPAREILAGVLSALDGRVVNDDVSAVVVKRI